jgi:hypothetical protein
MAVVPQPKSYLLIALQLDLVKGIKQFIIASPEKNITAKVCNGQNAYKNPIFAYRPNFLPQNCSTHPPIPAFLFLSLHVDISAKLNAIHITIIMETIHDTNIPIALVLFKLKTVLFLKKIPTPTTLPMMYKIAVTKPIVPAVCLDTFFIFNPSM